MGLLADIIGAISDDVVAELLAASYPALTDGKIVIGTAAEYENGAPPRIIFDPSPGSSFAIAEYSSASSTLDTVERRKQKVMRTIAAENVKMNVHCWGSAGTNEPVDDYDVTRALYHQVRASIHKVMPGAYGVDESGQYRTGSNIVRLGRWYTFGVTIYTPVLASLLTFDPVRQYAPADVKQVGDITYAPDGTISIVG